METGSLADVYLDSLATLYDAEVQALKLMPRLRHAARGLQLRDALARHGDQSRLHVERLQLIITHWGGPGRQVLSAGLAGIVQEADERLNDVATDQARDAMIIAVARRIEHYEIASYLSARSHARRLSRPDEARLLQETLEEEGRADRRLTEIAEAETDLELAGAMIESTAGFRMATPPHGDRLR